MTAELRQKIFLEISGLGPTQEIGGYALDGVAPTGMYRGYVAAVTTPARLDLGGATVFSLRMVTLFSEVGAIYVNPLASTNVSVACQISAGNGATFMYDTLSSAVPWIQGTNSTAAYSYVFTVVAT